MKTSLFCLLLGVFLTNTSFGQTQIADADGNTRVQTEALPNENLIRMVSNGLDRVFVGANAAGFTRMDVWNSNQCLFIGQGSGLNATGFGSNNTGLGFRAGEKISSGFDNTFVGQSAGSLTNTGNSNVAVGSGALLFNTSGSSNIAIGASCLNQLTTGSNNTGMGNFALSQNQASDNTAVGSSALQNNSSGANNTAIGRRAGQLNTTGSANTALGQEALRDNTSGGSNTALGFMSLSKNTAGFNVAVGSSALLNNSAGTNLSAVGANALFSNTVGSNNTALGRLALSNTTTGSGNTALGANAGDLATGNSNCTFLGFDTDNTLSGNLTNSTAIGNGARLNASNKIRLGNTAVSVIEGQVAYTVSDGRFKNRVRQDAPGLEFVLGLNPVTYNFDYTEFSNFLGEASVDYAVLAEKEQKREMGFIAQDLEALCRKQGVALANLVHAPEGEADNYSVAYSQLVVPLVKAVQEQQAQIEALQVLVAQLAASKDAEAPTASLKAWPNPTRGALNVSREGLRPGTMIQLLSADGKLLRAWESGERVEIVEFQSLPAGSYFLQTAGPGMPSETKAIQKSN